MSDADGGARRPDLREGVPLGELTEGEPFFGRVGDDAVFLLKSGDDVRAFGAKCTHYGAPLEDGLVHDGTIRCPWHHACFALADGTVRGGPAFDPLPRYETVRRDGRVIVGEAPVRDPLAPERPAVSGPDSVVIVGAGPAGTTAAETLRREGYREDILLVDPDPDAPYDRPNLSKAFLAGEAQEDWLPLRSRDFLREHEIQRLDSRVAKIDLDRRLVQLDTGATLDYGALLLAPGSVVRTLDVPGADLPHVRTLRSLEDCRSLIDAARDARKAVVVGASFIGMEVAASLRARDLDVTVVAPDDVPFQRTLGEELGSFLQSLHEDNGVQFRLGRSVAEVKSDSIALDDGSELEGELVVVGIGVDPDTSLALQAGLDIDDGILVDRYLRASEPQVFAAGDVARYPDPRSGDRIRIEHWVVAGRQGRTAARNILGRREAFVDVPFFWTRHFGQSVTYVGHATGWEWTESDGDCSGGSCAVSYGKDGRRQALATVGRSLESLRVEAEWEEEAGR